MKIIKHLAKYFGVSERDIVILEGGPLSPRANLSIYQSKCIDQMESLLTNRVGSPVTIQIVNDDTFNVIVDGIHFRTVRIYRA